MIEAIATVQNDILTSKPEARRKELGQFYTGSAVADYMASKFEAASNFQQKTASTIRMLDAGAGAGILAASAALRFLEQGCRQVHAVLYEIDRDILPQLEINLKQVAEMFARKGGAFTFDVRHEDFILARPDKSEDAFDICSINPPYFKYNSKTSPYSGATKDLYKGNPNIYASFMAVAAACMSPNGEVAAIVPRSFTNGLYFKGFRRYMNQTMSLENIHIFRARDRVFKTQSVLQENVIFWYSKRRQAPHVGIYTSTCYDDLGSAESRQYPVDLLIDRSNDHEIIRIPESAEDGEILQTVERWTSDFQENGYFISTGPVVEHRTRGYITKPDEEADDAPLLRMHNVKAFKIEWTGNNKKDRCFRLHEGHEKHTSDNAPYVVLKRFSSKDEKRRLVAAVNNPVFFKGKRIALENHLNYIGRLDGELSLAEAYGLAALLNSTFMDKYFRCISGNTQVNATEIRLLKLPDRETVVRLGTMLTGNLEFNQHSIDEIVNSQLSISKQEATQIQLFT